MTTYYTAYLLVRGTGALQVDKFSDELMSALIVRDEFVDPGLGVHLKTGLIDFSFGLLQGNPWLPVNKLFNEHRFRDVEILSVAMDDGMDKVYKSVEQYR